MGHFFNRKPSEIAQFDDANLPRIHAGQSVQSVIEDQQIHGLCLTLNGFLVQGHLHSAAPALRPALFSGVIDQDTPHHQADHGKEVLSILPVFDVLIAELDKGLVDEGGRLKGMPRAFTRQLASSQSTQVFIDQRDEGIDGVSIPRVPVAQVPRHRPFLIFHMPFHLRNRMCVALGTKLDRDRSSRTDPARRFVP